MMTSLKIIAIASSLVGVASLNLKPTYVSRASAFQALKISTAADILHRARNHRGVPGVVLQTVASQVDKTNCGNMKFEDVFSHVKQTHPLVPHAVELAFSNSLSFKDFISEINGILQSNGILLPEINGILQQLKLIGPLRLRRFSRRGTAPTQSMQTSFLQIRPDREGGGEFGNLVCVAIMLLLLFWICL